MRFRVAGRLLPVVLAAVFLAACSSKPSEKDGRAAFEKKLAASFPGVTTHLDGFQKTNGQMKDVAGSKVYVMYYSADVGFPDGLKPECLEDHSQFQGFNKFMEGANCVTEVAGEGLSPQYRGGRTTMTGTLEFESSEKGWLPTAFNSNMAKADPRQAEGWKHYIAGNLKTSPDQNDWPGAIAEYGLAIAAAPDLGVAYLYRAEAERKLGQYQAARADYTKSLDLQGGASPKGHYGLSCTLAKLGDAAGAAKEREIASSQNPDLAHMSDVPCE